MHWTTHIIIGANLGKALGNPALAGSVSFFSHAILDAIPHHDPNHNIGNLIDSILGGLILCYIKVRNENEKSPVSSSALSGAFFSALPDFELVVKVFADPREEAFFFPTHNGEIRHGRINLFHSLILESAIVAASLIAARFLGKRRQPISA